MTWQENYASWKEFTNLEPTLKANLKTLASDSQMLEDAFYQPLSFGTAGMRGILGAGINRMNIYTVRQATEGLAKLMESYGDEAAKRGVAIAYDSRHMSVEFALEAAKTLGAHNIPAFVFESLRPTPELSFAVRELNAFTGIMITASHNPANYNGYKVYGEDGGQMTPEDADALTQFVREVKDPLTVAVTSEEEILDKGLLTYLGETIDRKYLDQLQAVTINKDVIAKHAKDIKIVYTPLHGAGQMLVERALAEGGFEAIIYVDEQQNPDGDFPTVKSPNPEEAGAFELATQYGDANKADILIATDPDADRMGAAVRMPNGSYQVITGNQIGALLTHYILTAQEKAGILPANGAILKSIVSSEMPVIIAKDFNISTVNVLTGFKFIAEKIKQYEVDGNKTFLFGFEESYGYLVKPFVRDKDAVQATLLLAEVAAFYKDKGQTVYDGLQDLFKTYGYFKEKTISVKKPGQAGAAEIKALMTGLRENGLAKFGGQAVQIIEDYASSLRVLSDGTTEDILMDKANVLKYYLEDGTWIAVRPSGTEPKIKFYIGTVASDDETAVAKLSVYEQAVDQLANK